MNPHAALPRILVDHPEWKVAYDSDRRTYTARRPLSSPQRALGLREDSVSACDTRRLADLIAANQALRDGCDRLLSAPGLQEAGRDLIAGIEAFLQGDP